MSELSESDFKSIVDDVTADRRDSRLRNVETTGYSVVLEVLSNRRKQRWTANCNFDPQTGDVRCYLPYTNSGVVRGFAAEVQRRMDERRA